MPNLGGLIMNAVIRLKGGRLNRIINKQVRNLERSQNELLLKILKQNSATDFGKKHNFTDIKTGDDFRRVVPIHDYEVLRPYVESQDATSKPALLRTNPVFYAVTSGTTGKPKYIPLHKKALKSQQLNTNLFVSKLLQERPSMLSGKILAIVSPAVEGRMEASGLPYGSTSGHMYEGLPSVVKANYLVPSSVFAIEDYDLKYRTILRLALQEKNVTYLTTANPSTIAKLVSLFSHDFEQMLADIAAGTFCLDDKLSAECRSDVLRRLKANPARAQELRELKQSTAKLKICDLWPNLQAVATWTGGSSSIFLDQLKDQFPPRTLLRDLGYLASEFRGSVPITTGTNAGVPTFWNGYYEFAEQGEWDDGSQNFLGLHQLENKKRYYIFITTDYGLYRYNMNDIVEVDGSYRGCPLIRFVQKGKGVTSITGEKLYENQVLEAVTRVEKEFGAESDFFVMSCCPQESRYTLYYELAPHIKDSALQQEGIKSLEQCKYFQTRLDEVLGEINIEYMAKRKSGRVHPLRICVLKRGAYDVFKRCYLNAGQREGQFKIVALQFAKDIKFDFTAQVGWNGTDSDEINIERLANTRHASVVSAGPSAPLVRRPVVRLRDTVSL